MIFLHGGMVCPADVAAVIAAIPFLAAAWPWLRARLRRRR